ncbi:MAG: hypothetical protein M3450_06925, partial [Actinomycetota bacterium]|nr:hypothetical protein [Actinomycetota bacterium]
MVFDSRAPGLVAGHDIVSLGLYRYDRLADAVELVSGNTFGDDKLQREARDASVSDDGRLVAFSSGTPASNLVAGATDQRTGAATVFLRNMDTRVTALVAHARGSSAAVEASAPTVSGDGGTVVFEAYDVEVLVDVADGNGLAGDVFAYDTASSFVELLSPSATGTSSGNGGSVRAVPSRDGKTVVFLSHATDLVTGWRDANNWPPATAASDLPPLDYLSTDVFVRRRGAA